jgi:hypothetical protein
MGRWKASVLRVTRERKKRYCNPRDWDCRTIAFVRPSCGGMRGVVDVMFLRRFVDVDVDGWYGEVVGKGSFSMRDQVR